MVCEKDFIWNPATRICENGEYLASCIDDSLIMSDEIIDAVPSKASVTSVMQTE